MNISLNNNSLAHTYFDEEEKKNKIGLLNGVQEATFLYIKKNEKKASSRARREFHGQKNLEIWNNFFMYPYISGRDS